MICAQVNGEMVALNVEKGMCYGLDPIGSRIWDAIEAPTSIGEICNALVKAYRVDQATCERDVVDLIEELRDEGLLTLAASPSKG